MAPLTASRSCRSFWIGLSARRAECRGQGFESLPFHQFNQRVSDRPLDWVPVHLRTRAPQSGHLPGSYASRGSALPRGIDRARTVSVMAH